MVGAALASALPVLARTPWQLALLLAVLSLFERSAGSVQQGVIAQLATGGRGVLFKAYLRAVTNTAIGLGSVFGGAASPGPSCRGPLRPCRARHACNAT